ncbi:MAG TPA: type II toxin-antitoxin system VapC family toxin [Gemmatimonadaceae bacterium]|nr:type II toxin-antitoxin system VapC family toxin [Gemmatimonadaceae bacterium]
MPGFLLDTNVVSELIKPTPNGRVATWVDATDESLLYLSVLTIGEIRNGIARLARGARRARLEAWLETDLRPRFLGRIVDVDLAVADRWGVLTARAALAKQRVPAIDGLLAATAVQYNLTLATRNADDFEHTGASVFNPWRD